MSSRGLSGVVWPPHVCTRVPAPVNRGANAAKNGGQRGVSGAVCGPRTLRNAGASAVTPTACFIRFWLRLLAGGFDADGLGLGRVNTAGNRA